MAGKNRWQAMQKRREKKQREARLPQMVAIVIGVVVVGYIGYLLFRPAQGDTIAIAGSDHVEEGQPVQANSDPPTSGDHYSVPMPAGFYDEDSPEAQYPYPEGYLIHNLEHGYIIFWYNCDLLSEQACLALKEDIATTMQNSGVSKLVAFPWPSLKFPVVLTSWGQMLELENFDAERALDFIAVNRSKAPEAGAP